MFQIYRENLLRKYFQNKRNILQKNLSYYNSQLFYFTNENTFKINEEKKRVNLSIFLSSVDKASIYCLNLYLFPPTATT